MAAGGSDGDARGAAVDRADHGGCAATARRPRATPDLSMGDGCVEPVVASCAEEIRWYDARGRFALVYVHWRWCAGHVPDDGASDVLCVRACGVTLGSRRVTRHMSRDVVAWELKSARHVPRVCDAARVVCVRDFET